MTITLSGLIERASDLLERLGRVDPLTISLDLRKGSIQLAGPPFEPIGTHRVTLDRIAEALGEQARSGHGARPSL